MTIDEIKVKLQKNLTQKRYIHSINVMNTAVRLAQKYGADLENAAYAGLLHDCARDIGGEKLFELCLKFGIHIDEISGRQPELLHAQLGSKLALTEYEIDNLQVLKAIEYHITGCPGMDMLACIVFTADYIEPGRDFKGVDIIREEAYKNIDKAMILGINSTIGYVLQKGGLLHPDTVNTLNWLRIK
jgi:predicted HD superfamily hydrolase involved in NAD metabolism